VADLHKNPGFRRSECMRIFYFDKNGEFEAAFSGIECRFIFLRMIVKVKILKNEYEEIW